ncbi:hypothetical protein ACFPIF_07050 [Brevundimonas faecalis]|uniref:hypothetical protein n=1 Tax=Brevundimonas faecalis TaxID=947378 RepID=UPI003622B2FC
MRLDVASRDSSRHLDSAAIRRHLAQSDHDALMHEVEKAAAKSGAPFLAADKPLGEARIRWSQAFDALTRDAGAGQALASARSKARRALDASVFTRVKAERDALRRTTKTEMILDDAAAS